MWFEFPLKFLFKKLRFCPAVLRKKLHLPEKILASPNMQNIIKLLKILITIIKGLKYTTCCTKASQNLTMMDHQINSIQFISRSHQLKHQISAKNRLTLHLD